ncbi:MAG: multicopper oxidase domain-containing protein [Fulvivirga sp.]
MKYLIFLSVMFTICFSGYAQHEEHANAESTDQDSPYSYVPGKGRYVPPTGNTVVYNLTVSDTTVNYTGKKMRALATNGQIPAPTLRFTEGDTAVIYVHNRTKNTVSFHWHGILLPNKFDGVPLLTTELIESGETYLFKFKIIQNGTYWYHSHTELDEQKGQYGPIVIQPKDGIDTKEKVIHLSDWVNERPWEVLRTLKRHNDWYTIQRNAIQSYARAIATGNLKTKLWLEWNRMPDFDLADVYYDAFLANGMQTENATGFEPGDKVRLRVVNGSASSQFWLQFAGGKMTVVAADGLEVEPVEVDKVFIATAETYDVEITIPENGKYEFRATSWDMSGHASVWFGEGMTHAAPSLPQPDYFKLAGKMRKMSEMMDMTMGRAPKDIPDIKVVPPGEAPMPDMDMGKMPEDNHMQHDMRKMEDEQNMPDSMEMEAPMKRDDMHMKHQIPDTAATKGKVYKASEMSQEGMMMGDMNMGPLGTTMTGYQQVQASFPDETLLNYDMLRAIQPTTLPADNPTRIVHLYLTGNMFRYVWSINDLPLSRADKILINRGENVRFVMHNTTMMSHPMHLHGHFFRVVNKQGKYSPLKHTVNVAPMEMVTIEFEATEDKDWFFHCHLLYHLMSGMARVVSYEGSDVPPNTKKKYSKFISDDRAYFPFAELTLQSNGVWGEFNVANTYWLYNVEGEANWEGTFEIEPKIQRFIGPKQFFAAYVGAEVSREEEEDTETGGTKMTDRQVATLGIRYFLPMSLWADLRVDHEGNFQLAIEREEIPITQRWRIGGSFEYDLKDDWEYTVRTFYIVTKYTALSINYDSEFGFGGGVLIVY